MAQRLIPVPEGTEDYICAAVSEVVAYVSTPIPPRSASALFSCAARCHTPFTIHHTAHSAQHPIQNPSASGCLPPTKTIMAAGIINDFMPTLGAALKQAQQTSYGLIPAALTGSALWVAWWIWKFTLSPAIHPNAPRQLPYRIPCKIHLATRDSGLEIQGYGPKLMLKLVVGHVKSMMMDADKLFSYGRYVVVLKLVSWYSRSISLRHAFRLLGLALTCIEKLLRRRLTMAPVENTLEIPARSSP